MATKYGSKVKTARIAPRPGAPLVVFDKNQLGDKHLNPEESVIREREELLKMASNRKIWGQKELEDPDRASGPRLQFTEIISRLKRINPEIVFRDGMPGQLAVYVPKKRWEYDEQERDWSKDTFFWDHKYVGGIPKETVPEFAYVTTDTSGLAHREQKAWRSLLIGLIKSGAVKYNDVVKEFGEPNGPRSVRWFDQLHEYKYGKKKQGE